MDLPAGSVLPRDELIISEHGEQYKNRHDDIHNGDSTRCSVWPSANMRLISVFPARRIQPEYGHAKETKKENAHQARQDDGLLRHQPSSNQDWERLVVKVEQPEGRNYAAKDGNHPKGRQKAIYARVAYLRVRLGGPYTQGCDAKGKEHDVDDNRDS